MLVLSSPFYRCKHWDPERWSNGQEDWDWRPCHYAVLLFSFFLRFHLFIWERESTSRGKGEAGYPPRGEANTGLNPTTLGSWPDPGIMTWAEGRHSTHWATQEPQLLSTFKDSRYPWILGCTNWPTMKNESGPWSWLKRSFLLPSCRQRFVAHPTFQHFPGQISTKELCQPNGNILCGCLNSVLLLLIIIIVAVISSYVIKAILNYVTLWLLNMCLSN